MAPELLDDHHPDHTEKPTRACDYWSFGALAYVVLAGKHPYWHPNPSGLWSPEDNIKTDAFTVKPLTSGDTDAPDDVGRLIMTLLSREPRERAHAFRSLKSYLSSAVMPQPPEKVETPPTAEPVLTPEQFADVDDTYDQARFAFFC